MPARTAHTNSISAAQEGKVATGGLLPCSYATTPHLDAVRRAEATLLMRRRDTPAAPPPTRQQPPAATRPRRAFPPWPARPHRTQHAPTSPLAGLRHQRAPGLGRSESPPARSATGSDCAAATPTEPRHQHTRRPCSRPAALRSPFRPPVNSGEDPRDSPRRREPPDPSPGRKLCARSSAGRRPLACQMQRSQLVGTGNHCIAVLMSLICCSVLAILPDCAERETLISDRLIVR